MNRLLTLQMNVNGTWRNVIQFAAMFRPTVEAIALDLYRNLAVDRNVPLQIVSLRRCVSYLGRDETLWLDHPFGNEDRTESVG